VDLADLVKEWTATAATLAKRASCFVSPQLVHAIQPASTVSVGDISPVETAAGAGDAIPRLLRAAGGRSMA
jgi:hypothetical protein